MKTPKFKPQPQYIIYTIYFLCFFFGDIFGYTFRHVTVAGVDRWIYAIMYFPNNLSVLKFGLHPVDLGFGIAASAVLYFYIEQRKRNKKNFKKNVEYGSARWGTKADIKPYINHSAFRRNIILTQTEFLTIDKPSHPRYARNKNVLVIGGSGSGKTRFFLKPNLMQMHSSYIITDPNGLVC